MDRQGYATPSDSQQDTRRHREMQESEIAGTALESPRVHHRGRTYDRHTTSLCVDLYGARGDGNFQEPHIPCITHTLLHIHGGGGVGGAGHAFLVSLAIERPVCAGLAVLIGSIRGEAGRAVAIREVGGPEGGGHTGRAGSAAQGGVVVVGGAGALVGTIGVDAGGVDRAERRVQALVHILAGLRRAVVQEARPTEDAGAPVPVEGPCRADAEAAVGGGVGVAGAGDAVPDASGGVPSRSVEVLPTDTVGDLGRGWQRGHPGRAVVQLTIARDAVALGCVFQARLAEDETFLQQGDRDEEDDEGACYEEQGIG